MNSGSALKMVVVSRCAPAYLAFLLGSDKRTVIP